MIKHLKTKHPKVHKYLFTVTTLSKLLALYFFIFFPLAGFYLGVRYQQYVGRTGAIINSTPMVMGGERDRNGCLPQAGFTWCKVKNKCLRSWEEKCVVVTPSPTVLPKAN